MDVGAEFGNYRVVEHIGRGGMADVWSARDQRLSRTVAVKTIARNLRSDTSPIELFEREAKTIAALEHPHILPIYEFGDFEGQLYIVMRYVTGGSLADVVEQGPLPVADVLRLTRAVAEALGYAHSNHVVHLDIKPSNILLDSNRASYLADFGLAAVLGPEGRTENPGSGTLLYMAPEQLTAEVIDHRADIYSFCVMIYHLLVGQLPFDATTPLAFKQLQAGEQLPDIEDLYPNLPAGLTEILRTGTAMDADQRQDDMMALLRELEATLAPGLSASGTRSAARHDADSPGSDTELGDLITEMSASPDAQARREAMDIYQRARRAWAHGQGRFLLGVTHFMLVNDFYMHADRYSLEVDEAGMQVLLRGALEYDHEDDYWWARLDDDSRRWVALHALRSENAPARVRALQRLATVTDESPPLIPLQVAHALQVETNEQALLAGIAALEARGAGASEWREVCFEPEIDRLLATLALTSPIPSVAERAARAIARVRSVAAVGVIAAQQRQGAPGALRALALIRDEAPSLPEPVSRQARLYAWLANTWRRLTDRPMGLVWRTLVATLGAFIAIGMNTYFTFRGGELFAASRWKTTVALGLLCGVVYGVLVLFADELPSRLRGFWPAWARLLVGALFGIAVGTALWQLQHFLYLELENAPGELTFLVLLGAGAALGYVAASLFKLPLWLALPVTFVATYIPLYLAYTNYAIIYYDYPEQIFTLAIPMAVFMALGGYAPRLAHGVRVLGSRLTRRRSAAVGMPQPQPAMAAGMPLAAHVAVNADTEAMETAPMAGSGPRTLPRRLMRPSTAKLDTATVSGATPDDSTRAEVGPPDASRPLRTSSLRRPKTGAAPRSDSEGTTVGPTPLLRRPRTDEVPKADSQGTTPASAPLLRRPRTDEVPKVDSQGTTPASAPLLRRPRTDKVNKAEGEGTTVGVPPSLRRPGQKDAPKPDGEGTVLGPPTLRPASPSVPPADAAPEAEGEGTTLGPAPTRTLSPRPRDNSPKTVTGTEGRPSLVRPPKRDSTPASQDAPEAGAGSPADPADEVKPSEE